MSPDVMLEYKRQHVIDQLRKYKYYDVEGKSYNELKRKLAVFRAMEVDVSNSENEWF